MTINRMEALLIARVLREKAAHFEKLLGDYSTMKPLLEAAASALEADDPIHVQRRPVVGVREAVEQLIARRREPH